MADSLSSQQQHHVKASAAECLGAVSNHKPTGYCLTSVHS